MMMTPEAIDAWLQVFRRFALAIVGLAGLTILLARYWITGTLDLAVFGAFAGLLGLNALSLGKGSRQ